MRAPGRQRDNEGDRRRRRRRAGRLVSGAAAVALLTFALAESAVLSGWKGVGLLLAALVGLGAAVWATPSPFGAASQVVASPGARFVDHLAREFERSRRNSRTFVVARLACAPGGLPRGALRTLGAALRQSDVMGHGTGGTYLLMPETDRDDAKLAIKRLTAELPDVRAAIAEYPTDGITVGRLLEVLHDPGTDGPGRGDVTLEAYRALPEAAGPGREPAVLRAEARQLRVKRLVDLAVLAVVAPVALPLGLLLALAVRLDSPGKVLFVQERTGLHGHRFKMVKFRSMVHNAQELKASLQHLNILEPPDFKIVDDPRITRMGRFLRATSLDELPQLLNVLRGDMTLVGPRPTSFAADTYETWHTQRLEVPPGITGLWQVSARHESGFDERLRLDVGYIASMSLWNDVRIVGRTFGSVFRAKGA
jgi:lipopolysaccharide/colanic/teichoic acid biosynthesis glycosyltransferase